MERAPKPAKSLFVAAPVIYLITVVVGILNGLDLIEFNRNVLMTHVHAGTLGWITLGVIGISLWMFAAADSKLLRWMAYTTIASVLLFVVTFWAGANRLLPMTGSLVFIAIAAWFVWVVREYFRTEHSVPRLALLAALTTLTLGGAFGVLLALKLAGAAGGIPAGLFMAHPTTMVIGYLILVGMAVNEWALKPESQGMSRWGVAQVAILFFAALALTVGAVIDSFPLIAANVPLEIVGVTIFLVRLGPRLKRINWRAASPERLYGLSSIFLAFNIGLIVYLIASYANRIEEIPPWLFFALDHGIFIGVLTNAIFGVLYMATSRGRAMAPWAEHFTFYAMNLGLVGFVIGLIAQSSILKQMTTPVMGAGILVTMLALALRAREVKEIGEPVEERLAEAPRMLVG